MEAHERYMREAIRLALENVKAGCGGPFGAVVVKDGGIVGSGTNCVTSANDATAHAEVNAIRDACRRLGTFRLDGCVLYTNSEPCPMCLGAIYWARLAAVYYASTRQDAAAIGFDDALIYGEFNRPEGERRVPMRPMLRDEALPVFEEWRKKPDKVPY